MNLNDFQIPEEGFSTDVRKQADASCFSFAMEEMFNIEQRCFHVIHIEFPVIVMDFILQLDPFVLSGLSFVPAPGLT